MFSVSIDPGIRRCGVAIWKEKQLIRAGLVLGEHTKLSDPDLWGVLTVRTANFIENEIGSAQLDSLVIEFPQVYAGPRQHVNNDLLRLAGQIGYFTSSIYAHNYVLVLPREWKGQVPKPKRVSEPYIIAERLKKKLSKEELSKIELPKSIKYQYDVWDAIGLLALNR